MHRSPLGDLILVFIIIVVDILAAWWIVSALVGG